VRGYSHAMPAEPRNGCAPRQLVPSHVNPSSACTPTFPTCPCGKRCDTCRCHALIRVHLSAFGPAVGAHAHAMPPPMPTYPLPHALDSRDFVASCRKLGVSPCIYVIPAMDTFEDHAAPAAYLATQMAMLRELLTRYGQIDRLWFDYWGMRCGEYGGNFDIIRGLFPLFPLFGVGFGGPLQIHITLHLPSDVLCLVTPACWVLVGACTPLLMPATHIQIRQQLPRGLAPGRVTRHFGIILGHSWGYSALCCPCTRRVVCCPWCPDHLLIGACNPILWPNFKIGASATRLSTSWCARSRPAR